ncbi:serpin family protein [Candidatus Neomarinimicrobiota bacterium]
MMAKLRIPIVMVILGFLAGTCQSPTATDPQPKILPRDLTSDELELVSSSDQFGLKLFREIVRQQPDTNIFISPLSVSMALGMTANGAATTTLEAMRSTLELGDLTEEESNAAYESLIELLTTADQEVRFDIANSIWYRDQWSFNADFLQRCRDYFEAVIQGIDFSDPAAADIINAWVKENTNGKIEEIVGKPINPFAVMFLINALYYKGTWTYEFDPEGTVDDQFTLSDGSHVPCRMMMQEADLLYHETETFQAIDLPYGDGIFSMTILLPKPGISVDTMITALNPGEWASWISQLDTHGVLVELPRFKFRYELVLNETLNALGMGIAFSNLQADFSRMLVEADVTIGNIYIGMVKHKTFVQVDEEGTEAAAVTAVVVGVTSEDPGDGLIHMRIDRPFAFVIRERTSGALLFMGKIVHPVWEE